MKHRRMLCANRGNGQQETCAGLDFVGHKNPPTIRYRFSRGTYLTFKIKPLQNIDVLDHIPNYKYKYNQYD